MSAPKRLKIEAKSEEKAEIIVDLGNGILGRLRTHGSEETTIQDRRWQQFKEELYQSNFWHQYKEKLENPEWEDSEEGSKEAYKDVVEREIQRAWDESGKGGALIPVPPQTQICGELRGFSDRGPQCLLPDIPLSIQSAIPVEVGLKESGGSEVGELKKERAMAQNGERLQRYLVTVEYLGSRFLGWQKQKNRPDLRTVQGALEEAFNKFVGKPVTCGGSSRTDTGVHALANVCHVDVERVSKRKQDEVLPPHEPDVVRRAVNHFLQKDGGDMMVVAVQAVRNDFHARFHARERTYHYRILAGCVQTSVFEKDRAWHVPEDLSLAAMREASQVLVGHHDFSSFRAAGCQAKSPVKTLDELHVCEMTAFPSFPAASERIPYMLNSGANKQSSKGYCSPKANDDECHPSPSGTSLGPRCYVITARARSFLYHQVRLLVGTIKAAGSGVLTVEDVRRILATKSIKATPAMAPACGLYLAEVKYDVNDFKCQECISNESEGQE